MSRTPLWTRSALILLLGAVVFALALALRAASWRPFDLAGSTRDDGFFHVSGAVHSHTLLSDGGGAPTEVIAAAQAAGLGFVAITDHNNVDAKPFESYYDGVLVLVGSELSTNAGHLLALGIPDPGYRFSGDAHEGLDDVRDLDGVAFAAHPWSPRQDLRWTGWDLPGPWGIEVLNIDSAWRRAGWLRIARAVVLYGFNPRYALLSALNTTGGRLADWDALLAERNVPGIVGTDAHSRVGLTDSLRVRFPTYESLFSFAQNHVLLDGPLRGDAVSDAVRVLDALHRGASYSAVDALASADGFFFTVESADRQFTMGDTAPLGSSRRFVAGGRLPARTRLTLLRDGRSVAEREGAIVLPVPGPGVYRVEARLPGWTVPWILSNPIYIYDDATRDARASRAAWPRTSEPPLPVQVLDAFEGDTIFQAGFDASSWTRSDILDPMGGADGRGAGRIEFRLGLSGSPQPFASCEVANREPRDLTGHTGLVFSIKSDAPYRLWVQVRDHNPALTESTETWFASVRSSTDWRRVAIPFAALRSNDPETDGTLDLDEVRALAFVLDRGAVKIGTAGTIWIDDFGVY